MPVVDERRFSPLAVDALAADSAHLGAVLDVVAAQLCDLEDRRAGLRLQRVPPGAARMQRDLEITALSARVHTLSRLGTDICLGRFDRAGRVPDLRRPARPARRRGPHAAGRLAHAGGRALLRGDPGQADGRRAATPVPLVRRRRGRQLGRVARPRRRAGADRPAGRAERLPRLAGREPDRPDDQRPRHDPGRPGRDRPRTGRAGAPSSTADRAPARPSSRCTARPSWPSPARTRCST